MNRTDAYTILFTAGFTVQFIDEPRSDIAAGTVLAQMPLPGEVTVKGTIVVLNVAAAAPAPAVTVTVTPTPSPSTTTP
jgi:beta-lactam-binding protein with PASTA domain